MITPLPAAIDSYETMKEIRSLLKSCLYHPDMSDPEGWIRHAVDLIEAIDLKYPMKASAILINKENENESD